MSRLPHFSHFSIEMASDCLYYVSVGKIRLSAFFKDKQICREFCDALDRSFNRLHNRYSFRDYQASIVPVGDSNE